MAATAKTTDGFSEWLLNTAKFFRTLTDDEKNQTLDSLIAASGAVQLYNLHRNMEILLFRDFLRMLSPELIEILLQSLDTKSLLAACCVSQDWNRIVSNSSSTWLKACENYGLIVDRQIIETGKYWKSYFLEMSDRKKKMKTGACFETEIYPRQLRTVTAVYYFNGRLATASDSLRVELWDCATSECLLTVRSTSSITAIKFNNHRLIAASNLGYILSWESVTGIRLTDYFRHASVVLAFDFSEAINILVTGSGDTKIKIWSLQTGSLIATLNDHNSWVVQIILRPLPRESDQKDWQILFSMDKCRILVWHLLFGEKRDDSSGFYLNFQYSIPIHRTEVNDISYTPGLHFDGRFIYFVRQDFTAKVVFLCKFNIFSRELEEEIDLGKPILVFLGIGQKYAAFLTSQVNRRDFFVIDVKTKETAIQFDIPVSGAITPNIPQTTLCQKSWLDGLNGKNDLGDLLATALMTKTVQLMKWIPRD